MRRKNGGYRWILGPMEFRIYLRGHSGTSPWGLTFCRGLCTGTGLAHVAGIHSMGIATHRFAPILCSHLLDFSVPVLLVWRSCLYLHRRLSRFWLPRVSPVASHRSCACARVDSMGNSTCAGPCIGTRPVGRHTLYKGRDGMPARNVHLVVASIHGTFSPKLGGGR